MCYRQLDRGVLPEGIHPCTMEEVEQVFGRFSRSDRRVRLTQSLRLYIQNARAAGVGVAILIDGSYVTSKAEPNDIDILLVLRRDIDLAAELHPMEYNIQSARRVKRLYGFDVLSAVDGSEAYHRYVSLFSRVRPDDPEQPAAVARKGLLRIEL